jgi:hypothetical protein
VSGSAEGGAPTPTPTPTPHDADALDTLRDALRAADFTVERVESQLAVHELSQRPGDLAVQLRRVAGDDAFSTLARLFLLGVGVDPAPLADAVAPLALERVAAAGLVREERGRIVPEVRLVPHGDYYLASDLPSATAEAVFDHVAGIHAPSVTLAKLAVRREVEATLDVGTGCGIQALLAAKHSRRVVATDVNRRALAFASFNARLNGVSGVELVHGDGFAPVAGRLFDLVVANPPYVVSPDYEYAFRDSGRPGDELCRELVRRAPAALAEGGFAHLLVSWVVERDGDWSVPLREWVAGSGCDAWLLHYRTDDPLTHAAGWLAPLAEHDSRAHEEALARWLAYFDRAGVEAVAYGAVVLRRRRAPNWVRVDELPIERLETAGDQILRVFAAEDFVRATGDEAAILRERFAVVERHRVEQTLRCRDGGLTIDEVTLVLDEGLGFRASLDRYTIALLPQLDGTRPLGDVLERLSSELPLAAAERALFVPAAVPVVKRLLELGFLERAS